MSEFWDNRYNKEEYIYGRVPNLFFKEQLDKLTPGKILLPADGEGRNGVYAASRGWDVTAFDISEAGKKKALKLAAMEGVELRYDISSYLNYSHNPEEFDAIGLIYTHMPTSLRKTFHKNMTQWLKPGGTVILEAFNKQQFGRDSGGPKELDMLYNLDDLYHDFEAYEIRFAEAKLINLNEGEYHQGEASVIRLVAEKI